MKKINVSIVKYALMTSFSVTCFMVYTKMSVKNPQNNSDTPKMETDFENVKYSVKSQTEAKTQKNDHLETGTASNKFKVNETTHRVQRLGSFPSKEIPLVTVLCSKNSSLFDLNNAHKLSWPRQEQQLKVMFGSLLLLSELPWRVVVLTDSPSTYGNFLSLFSDWTEEYRSRLLFERQELNIPMANFVNKWRPCSWIKLFVGDLLPQFDKIVYLDTDVLFLGPAEDLWLEFDKLKNETFLGIGAEPWYFHENKDKELHKVGGKLGVNTGTILMDLKKLRSMPFKFSEEVTKEIKNVQNPRHDQDVMNSFLHKNPQYLYELSSRFNFLPSVCTVESCGECLERGVLVFHGADGSFYSHVDPRFNVIFAVFDEEFSTASFDPLRVRLKLQTQLEFLERSNQAGVCRLYSNFTSMILNHLQSIT